MGLDARVNTFIKVVYTLFLDITIFLIRSYFFGHFGFWSFGLFFTKKSKPNRVYKRKNKIEGSYPKTQHIYHGQ